MQSVIVGIWNANKPDISITFLYHGISREKAIICFINQYFKHNYNSWEYSDTIQGIRKSNVIKDRLLYDYSEDIIVYAQYN